MTRDQCIESMAREIALASNPDATWDWYSEAGRNAFRKQATAAYYAMADHIQAERERVREMCAAFCAAKSRDFKEAADEEPDVVAEDKLREIGRVAAWMARDLRALDIGGEADASRISELEAERDRLREALAFYADSDNYRNFPIDVARKRNGGEDPTTYNSAIGMSAPFGTALSAIQFDSYGSTARAALGDSEDTP